MRRYAALIICTTILGLPNWCVATGFYVPQQTAYGAGRANAGGVAMARDASTVFFNPAGMTQLKGPEMIAALNIVRPSASFTNRGTTFTSLATAGTPVAVAGNSGGQPGSPTPVGSLFYARPASSKWWMGIGISAPFGLKVQYPSRWFGRYDSIESRLITVDVAPTIAYGLTDTLSLGAGLNIQYADLRSTSAIPNTLSPQGFTATTDGRNKITGDDLTAGYNAGLLWNVTPSTRVGVHYRSKMDHDIDGHNKVSGLTGQLGVFSGKFSIETKLKLPDVLSAGFAHELNRRTTIVGEAQWFGWNRFEESRIRFANSAPDLVFPQDYRNTYTVSAGAEHLWRDNVTLRAGVQYDRTPTVDEYRNTSVADGNRIWTAVGVSYRPSQQTELTLSFQHVFFDDPNIDVTRTFFAGTPAQGNVRIRGRADSHVNTLSLAFRYAL